MAKRGRKPDPPALRMEKENAARLSVVGPFAHLRTGGEPPKPEVIAGDEWASAEWDRLVDLLSGQRTLSPADMAHLAAYCSAWSSFCRIMSALNEGDLTTRSEQYGATKATPLLAALRSAEKNLISFAGELGLGAVNRGRTTAPEDVERKLDRYRTPKSG